MAGYNRPHSTKPETYKRQAKAVSARFEENIELKRDGEVYAIVDAIKVTFLTEDGKQVEWPAFLGKDQDKNAKSLQGLRHCGWEGTDPLDLTGIDTNYVQLVLEDKAYKNKYGKEVTTTKVWYVNKLAQTPKTTGTTPKNRANYWSDVLKSLEGGPKGPASTPQLPVFDDDIPF